MVVSSTTIANPLIEKCAGVFVLDTSVPNQIDTSHQREESEDWSIDFIAYVEENKIYSATTYYSKYGEDQFGTPLIFPYTDDREIPGMVHQVVNALHELLWIPIACDLSADIGVIYEEFADVLYNYSTMSFGSSQLRFSLMYHVSVMHNDCACSKSDLTICTPSPAYEFSNEL